MNGEGEVRTGAYAPGEQKLPQAGPPSDGRGAQWLPGHSAPRLDGFKALIEGDPATGRFCIRFVPAEEGTPPSDAGPDHEAPGIAARVFQLLTALDPDNRLRKAPPIKVFNLFYRQGLPPGEIARKCRCHRTLVFRRLTAIEKQLPWKPEQLRQVSAHVEAMEEAVRDSRASRLYRKGALEGDEGEA